MYNKKIHYSLSWSVDLCSCKTMKQKCWQNSDNQEGVYIFWMVVVAHQLLVLWLKLP